MRDSYMQHCETALRTHGDAAYVALSSSKHFHTWVREQKAQDPARCDQGSMLISFNQGSQLIGMRVSDPNLKSKLSSNLPTNRRAVFPPGRGQNHGASDSKDMEGLGSVSSIGWRWVGEHETSEAEPQMDENL